MIGFFEIKFLVLGFVVKICGFMFSFIFNCVLYFDFSYIDVENV